MFPYFVYFSLPTKGVPNKAKVELTIAHFQAKYSNGVPEWISIVERIAEVNGSMTHS